jgi:transcriptional regulator with XRE-family HTH domain
MIRWKLKQVIEEKGLTMRQMAILSGVSYSTIRKLCRNPRQYAMVHTLSKLADALQVAYAQLIETEDV